MLTLDKPADSGVCVCTGDPDPVVQTDDPTEEVLPVSALRLSEPGPASLDGTWGEHLRLIVCPRAS
jgi:hypothetical protein